MSSISDIVIVGGGVIGLTTAYFLAEEGASVVLLEKGELGQQASWAGAGILPPAKWSASQSPHEQFRSASLQMYPRFSQILHERTGIDNGYNVCGGLELLDADEVDDEEWRTGGLTASLVETDDLHRLEPALAEELRRAYHLTEMAQVRNPRHLKALIAACQQLGVRFETHCPIHSLRAANQRVQEVVSERGSFAGGQVVLAMGAWSETLLNQVGWKPGIRPVRGQMALLNTGKALIRHILLWGRQYLVPRDDGRVLIGSTEEEAGFDARPTAGHIADLIQLGTRVVSMLADATVERCWAGLRPGTPDGLPFLGPVPEWKNLWVSAGHYRSGILLSPGTGWAMKEWLLHDRPALPASEEWTKPTKMDLSCYALDR